MGNRVSRPKKSGGSGRAKWESALTTQASQRQQAIRPTDATTSKTATKGTTDRGREQQRYFDHLKTSRRVSTFASEDGGAANGLVSGSAAVAAAASSAAAHRRRSTRMSSNSVLSGSTLASQPSTAESSPRHSPRYPRNRVASTASNAPTGKPQQPPGFSNSGSRALHAADARQYERYQQAQANYHRQHKVYSLYDADTHSWSQGLDNSRYPRRTAPAPHPHSSPSSRRSYYHNPAGVDSLQSLPAYPHYPLPPSSSSTPGTPDSGRGQRRLNRATTYKTYCLETAADRCRSSGITPRRCSTRLSMVSMPPSTENFAYQSPTPRTATVVAVTSPTTSAVPAPPRSSYYSRLTTATAPISPVTTTPTVQFALPPHPPRSVADIQAEQFEKLGHYTPTYSRWNATSRQAPLVG